MAKWCISVVLVLALTGSVLAGTSVHSGEQHCPMGGQDDCCAKAQSQKGTPEVYVARLCCSLNCTTQGTTAPTGTINISTTLALALSTAVTPPLVETGNMRLARAYTMPERNQHSPPFYIQHLALLI
jgi:hypothetical protein